MVEIMKQKSNTIRRSQPVVEQKPNHQEQFLFCVAVFVALLAIFWITVMIGLAIINRCRGQETSFAVSVVERLVNFPPNKLSPVPSFRWPLSVREAWRSNWVSDAMVDHLESSSVSLCQGAARVACSFGEFGAMIPGAFAQLFRRQQSPARKCNVGNAVQRICPFLEPYEEWVAEKEFVQLETGSVWFGVVSTPFARKEDAEEWMNRTGLEVPVCRVKPFSFFGSNTETEHIGRHCTVHDDVFVLWEMIFISALLPPTLLFLIWVLGEKLLHSNE